MLFYGYIRVFVICVVDVNTCKILFLHHKRLLDTMIICITDEFVLFSPPTPPSSKHISLTLEEASVIFCNRLPLIFGGTRFSMMTSDSWLSGLGEG